MDSVENSLACGLSNFICKELNTSYLASTFSIHHHWHWNFRVVLQKIPSSRVRVFYSKSEWQMLPSRWVQGATAYLEALLFVILMQQRVGHWKELFPKHLKFSEAILYLTFIGNCDLILQKQSQWIYQRLLAAGSPHWTYHEAFTD